MQKEKKHNQSKIFSAWVQGGGGPVRPSQMTFLLSVNVSLIKRQMVSVGKDVGTAGPSDTARGAVRWGGHCGRRFSKGRTQHETQPSQSGAHPREMKTVSTQKLGHQGSLQHWAR